MKITQYIGDWDKDATYEKGTAVSHSIPEFSKLGVWLLYNSDRFPKFIQNYMEKYAVEKCVIGYREVTYYVQE